MILKKKSSDAMMKKVRMQEEALDSGHKERDMLLSKVNGITADLDKEKREGEKLQKQILEMNRERDKTLANMQKQDGTMRFWSW